MSDLPKPTCQLYWGPISCDDLFQKTQKEFLKLRTCERGSGTISVRDVLIGSPTIEVRIKSELDFGPKLQEALKRLKKKTPPIKADPPVLESPAQGQLAY